MRQLLIAGVLGVAACFFLPGSQAEAQYGYGFGRNCGPGVGFGVPGAGVGYRVGYGYSYAAPFPYVRTYQSTRVVVPGYGSSLYRSSRPAYGWGGYGNIGYPSPFNRPLPRAQLRIGF